MNHLTTDQPVRYCGRLFTAEEMAHIRRLLVSEPNLNRAQLSRRVCSDLRWLRGNGRSKEMSCRVAMLRMERDGLITLPPPLKSNGNGRHRPRPTSASDPRAPLLLSAGAIGPLDLRPVDTPPDSALWNELIQRYHYLGYKPLPGAQIRYLVYGGGHLLAVLGFGAAAWKVAPRDEFIGWDRGPASRRLAPDRQQRPVLDLALGNRAEPRLPHPGRRRQTPATRLGQPVWLSALPSGDLRPAGSFPGAPATVRPIGSTSEIQKAAASSTGNTAHALPVKHVYLYPLHRRFRQQIHATAGHQRERVY